MFLFVAVILVHGVLTAGMFQLDRNFHLRLVDLVVFAKGLKMRGQNLHTQRTIRNPVDARAALRIRLQFHFPVGLFALAL